jgi:hypothetical protein
MHLHAASPILKKSAPIMKKTIITCLAGILLLCSCQKSSDNTATTTNVINQGFTRFTIPSGQHSSENNSFKAIELSEMKFTVKFDSSAIYTTVDPSNQFDINKLYGFSDNGTDHHQYSARYGWTWTGSSLKLFAYVYNQGAVISRELATVAIGSEISCSIQATPTGYLFTTNGVSERLPRMASTPLAKGYQLYPYFGGDETAPHSVNIWIKNL